MVLRSKGRGQMGSDGSEKRWLQHDRLWLESQKVTLTPGAQAPNLQLSNSDAALSVANHPSTYTQTWQTNN
jgi:hypothetical protein